MENELRAPRADRRRRASSRRRSRGSQCRARCDYVTYAQILSHPVTRIVRTFVRRTVMVCAVILAVTFVTTISADLGPALRAG